MKKVLLIILLLIVGCEKQKEYNFDEIIEREGSYYKKFTEEIVNGFVFGEIEGTKARFGRMRNGKKDGKWIYWHKNGDKKEEGTYKNGVGDGLWTSWYENGQKSKETTYVNGVVFSEECWDRDGNECEECTWWNRCK